MKRELLAAVQLATTRRPAGCCYAAYRWAAATAAAWAAAEATAVASAQGGIEGNLGSLHPTLSAALQAAGVQGALRLCYA